MDIQSIVAQLRREASRIEQAIAALTGLDSQPELRRVVAEPKKDTRELFRRMCFNALVSNIDDHPRNHAVIAKDKDWKLSPAYDLTPAPMIAQERRDLAMECGDMGRYSNAKNILSKDARFLLDEHDPEGACSMGGRR